MSDSGYCSLVVEGNEGSRYYRHVPVALSVEDRRMAINETIEFAGRGSRVVRWAVCPKTDHASGMANCRHGVQR